ncbi:MAG: hypothetical protein AAGC60_16530 [Acidobacteriota bacterium]
MTPDSQSGSTSEHRGRSAARDDSLWLRLERFELDDPESSLPFSHRLARENGWRLGYALRVVGEYRRFVYLAMVAGHEVTPSDEVDQAWHLHLLYTRSYWDAMCGEVLGRSLHHGPTRGGGAERDRYHEQYEATLASYRRLFEREPPVDIWPGVEQRFQVDSVRVDQRAVWIVSKPGWLRGLLCRIRRR